MKQRYKRTPRYADALLWTGANLEEMRNFVNYHLGKGSTIQIYIPEDPELCKVRIVGPRSETEYCLDPFEFLVIEDGRITVYEPDVFKHTYEPVGE